MLDFLSRKPLLLLVLVHIMGFGVLYYKNQCDNVFIYTGAGFAAAILLACAVMYLKAFGDNYLFLIVSMLMSLGLMMLLRINVTFGFRQLVWLGIGIVLFFTSYWVYIKVNLWNRLIYFYLGMSLAVFAVTFLFGKTINGATNWIVIGEYSFQTSEAIKLLFIFFAACYYHNPKKLALNVKLPLGEKTFYLNMKSNLVMLGLCYGYMGFMVIQREWGTAMLLFMVMFSFLYVFEKQKILLAANTLLGVLGAVCGYLFMYHIKVRVETWLNPWNDISNKGYQITQSLFAISEGGFFGSGLGRGSPYLIPNVTSDFIFSAICEEMGILGGGAVILLYFILTYRGFKITLAVADMFDKVIALGITLMFGFQTFIIIGGVIKLIPLTGITLPFISYGGSSVVISFIALGILQAVSSKNIKA